MCSKLKFNNLVISNKGGIQQSRIQTINKLVHKIRRLKALLEKHPDDAKCKERLRKSTETVDLLKKIKKVEIMKQVLLMDKAPSAVITNGLATPEEVAIAILSMNKVMLGLIKKFKAELLFDESNKDEWRNALTETSKRRQKKERTLEKRRKRMEAKQQKIIGLKRQKWLEQNCPKAESQNDENLNISTTGIWNVEELTNEVQENKKDVLRTLDKKPLQAKDKNAIRPKIKQNSEENEHINELHTVQDNSSLKSSNKNKEIAKKEEESLVIDPFFITDTGENYLSSAVITKDQSAYEDEDEEKKDLHMINLNNYEKKTRDFKNRFQKSHDKIPKDFRIKSSTITNRKHKQVDLFHNSSRNNKRRDTHKDFNLKEPAKETNQQNLHPSWAAKQKLKPVIMSFQGKKIKFDDESSNNQGKVHQSKNAKLSTFENSNAEKDSLHPSWAAKQKLKPTIAPFQGKKIIFDDD